MASLFCGGREEYALSFEKESCKENVLAMFGGGAMYGVSASQVGTVYSKLQGLMKQEGIHQMQASLI